MDISEAYWIVDAGGHVHPFGGAPALGSLADQGVSATIVAMAARPQLDGYWLLGEDGGVFSFGRARFHGTPHAAMAPGARAAGIAAAPDGGGYWVLDDLGVVHAFGTAPHLGNLPYLGEHVRARRIVAHPSATGYWLLDHVGGVFSFGEATFHGALPGEGMPAEPAALVPHADGEGYLVVTVDGRTCGFGSWRNVDATAAFDLQRTRGLVGACRGAGPASGLALDRDGIIYPLGEAGFAGSLVGRLAPHHAVAIAGGTIPSVEDELTFKHPIERRAYSRLD